MEKIYWIHEWAKIRQAEVVRLPDSLNVHNCFLNSISKTEFDSVFREIWNMYVNIYGDILKSPERFGMPLYKIEEYNCFSTQARASRIAPYRPFHLLYNMLITGVYVNGDFIVDNNKFKAINKVKNVHILFERLSDYGFFFEGLKNYNVMNQDITMLYPDNPILMLVLKLMADKAYIMNRLDNFFCCHYKLFQDDMNTVNYGYGADVVADKMHTKEEQEFIYAMDNELKNKGYFAHLRGWNEGPGYAYYDKERIMKSKGPYLYWLLSWKTHLILYLRIRNVSKCLEYIKQCPDSMRQIFLHGDSGCENRVKGTCKFGQEYTIDGITYWKCGCCNAPFYFHPIKEDIPHYIRLVELGGEK